ncbi:hypothetical protein BRADI_4g17023v3 [Brachypodium distachyon]|uniref:Uncharacterized protein n=1 Tax=Brachypodium distachyon TaxID=15368 RepID=A0A2K2CNB2_BRADI|nr:hypothetical protein BRADI_4g17023v3 [Brachypodium distachyon]
MTWHPSFSPPPSQLLLSLPTDSLPLLPPLPSLCPDLSSLTPPPSLLPYPPCLSSPNQPPTAYPFPPRSPSSPSSTGRQRRPSAPDPAAPARIRPPPAPAITDGEGAAVDSSRRHGGSGPGRALRCLFRPVACLFFFKSPSWYQWRWFWTATGRV